jgi:Asp-tRNA(Asn)/Glu-tRNA(Gln) amidotransferase A subunit family amidase
MEVPDERALGYVCFELAEIIRSKKASSLEVVQAHLDRIKAVNGKVNGVTVTLAETAMEAADLADRLAPEVAGLIEAQTGHITPIDPR